MLLESFHDSQLLSLDAISMLPTSCVRVRHASDSLIRPLSLITSLTSPSENFRNHYPAAVIVYGLS